VFSVSWERRFDELVASGGRSIRVTVSSMVGFGGGGGVESRGYRCMTSRCFCVLLSDATFRPC
jgi:hypothetical protein